MTKDSKLSRISDSASGGTEETMALEIREENKVKERLMAILRTDCGRADCKDHSGEWLANQIIQSTDLRVTLVEPKFVVSSHGGKPMVVRRNEGIDEEIAMFRGHPVGKQLAQDYADWLNSKEPK